MGPCETIASRLGSVKQGLWGELDARPRRHRARNRANDFDSRQRVQRKAPWRIGVSQASSAGLPPTPSVRERFPRGWMRGVQSAGIAVRVSDALRSARAHSPRSWCPEPAASRPTLPGPAIQSRPIRDPVASTPALESQKSLLSFPKVFFTAQRFKLTFEASGGFGYAKHRQAQSAACRER